MFYRKNLPFYEAYRLVQADPREPRISNVFCLCCNYTPKQGQNTKQSKTSHISSSGHVQNFIMWKAAAEIVRNCGRKVEDIKKGVFCEFESKYRFELEDGKVMRQAISEGKVTSIAKVIDIDAGKANYFLFLLCQPDGNRADIISFISKVLCTPKIHSSAILFCPLRSGASSAPTCLISRYFFYASPNAYSSIHAGAIAWLDFDVVAHRTGCLGSNLDLSHVHYAASVSRRKLDQSPLLRACIQAIDDCAS